ncbi:hypothetical protein LTR36_001659 [Oleoguttula mirabilis]|uniref:Uncharacterized protein n=1 Tax=Oleoguttula mirabilis TaxID=1507867 RepID=A0AAV9JN02_9PEZI|nr:hypothetical protein LTR36_001659 [Oleoguttula mirabilis]
MNFMEGLKQCYNYYGLPEDCSYTVYRSLTYTCHVMGAQYADMNQGEWFNGGFRLLRASADDEDISTKPDMMSKLRAALEAELPYNPLTNTHLLEGLAGLDISQSSRYTEQYGTPDHFLTPRMTGASNATFKGACKQMPTLLNIPPFKAFSDDEDDNEGDHLNLAYCAKSKAAWFIAADAKKQGLTTLTLFKQAALLEEAFVW